MGACQKPALTYINHNKDYSKMENAMTKDLFTSAGMRFNGSDYVPEFDNKRLTGQIKRIYELMKDGRYRTLKEIEDATGDPQASISAQIRHLKKTRFGSHTVNKRRRGDPTQGLFEYQLIIKSS